MFENKKIMKKYKKLMDNENVSNDEVQKFLNKNMNQYLYRYRPTDFIKTEVMEGVIKLSTADNYNDPFDCGFYINVNQYYKLVNLPMQEILDFVSLNVDISKLLKRGGVAEKLVEAYQRGNLLACFSERCDNILMWSHYAEDHKGICIKYDYNKLSDGIKNNIFPAIYSKSKYDASKCLACHNVNISRNPSFYKLNMWSYEEEFRFRIDNDMFDKIIEEENRKKVKEMFFLKVPNAIVEITFGVKFNFLDQRFLKYYKELSDYAKKNNIQFFRNNIKYDSSIEFEKIYIDDLELYVNGKKTKPGNV